MQDKNLLFSNTCRIAMFIILAVCFEKWWISMFSLFFLTYPSKQ